MISYLRPICKDLSPKFLDTIKHCCLISLTLEQRGHAIDVSVQRFTLRERLRTHKVFIEDQCFYLNYHNISIKSYVVNVS